MKKRTLTTLLFAISYFFYYLCRYNYPIALPFIKEEFALSAAQIGTIATALTLGYAVGQLINGVLADRYGPRLILTIGGLGSMVANLAMGGSAFYTALVFGWFVNGYFQAMGYPASLRLISNWFKREERGKQVGWSEAAQSVASVLILPVAAWLASRFSWRMVFVGPSLVMGAAMLWYYRKCRDYPEHIGPEDSLDHFKAHPQPLLAEMIERYRLALGNWRLVAANVSYGLCQFVRYAMVTWIPSYLYETTGESIMAIAIKGTAFQLGGVFGSILVGWLSDLKIFNSRRWLVISICMVGSAIAAAAVGFVPPGIWTILALGLCGVGIESIEVAYFLTPSDFLGDDMTATGVGCMNATGKLIASLQGTTLGFIIDRFGYGSAFGTAGVFGLLAAILVIPSGFRGKAK